MSTTPKPWWKKGGKVTCMGIRLVSPCPFNPAGSLYLILKLHWYETKKIKQNPAKGVCMYVCMNVCMCVCIWKSIIIYRYDKNESAWPVMFSFWAPQNEAQIAPFYVPFLFCFFHVQCLAAQYAYHGMNICPSNNVHTRNRNVLHMLEYI